MTRQNRLSRMIPTHFCELSSDVGNALIAGADEQILKWSPIVQKWSALLTLANKHLVSLVEMGCAPPFSHSTAISDYFEPTSRIWSLLCKLVHSFRRIVVPLPLTKPQSMSGGQFLLYFVRPLHCQFSNLFITFSMLSGIFDDIDGGFDDTDEEFEQLIGRTVSFVIPKGAFVNSVFGQSLSRASFLTMETSKELPFSDGSILYSSLVARVKQDSPFDEAVQNQAVELLKMLEPKPNEIKLADSIIKDLVPSSAGSTSGFVDSIVTLLSSPHSRVVAAAISFLYESMRHSSLAVRHLLVESDLISKLFTTAQTHILPTSINGPIFSKLVDVIDNCLNLAAPFNLWKHHISTTVDQFNHRGIIFQKVVIPLSQFVTSLFTNRPSFNGDVFRSFMYLLDVLLRMCPFHRPTLEYVLASPIVMAFSSCLSFVEDDMCLSVALRNISDSLYKWKKESPQVAQSGKRMLQSLFSESFEDTLEQMMMFEKSKHYGFSIVNECHAISKSLGLNVGRL
ncbi:hypothetical protein BLNAU_3462 [Blattamonas nauphoetae]|uniref:Uncharacterized protein n=1 Tax=Blattamonas nauphoetae TaxID=2049346 RepID=A0ABQ9YD43_9EUKA|nr:hypothetical protein BLNAU_3462 [Blattamonas nauphoetae]